VISFVAVYVERDEGIVAYIEELPGVEATGLTVEEARRNLRSALELVIAANRRWTWEAFRRARMMHRETLLLPGDLRPYPANTVTTARSN